MGFLKTFLATLLAIMASLFFLFIIGVIMVVSSQRETEPYIRSGSVLEIKLGNTLPERPPQDPFSLLFSDPRHQPVTLSGLKENLEKAAVDDRIEGLWLKMNNISAPWPTLIALRNEMLAFREESGKFIYVTTDDIGFNESSYFLATAADSIFSPPETFFEFDGFFIQAIFFKDMLDKLGIQAQVFQAGDYKGAIEAFSRNDLSPENREQLQSIIDNVADLFLEAVSQRSGHDRSELDRMLNEAPFFTASAAAGAGFIDRLIYPEEMKERIEKTVLDLDHREMHTVPYHRYNRVSRSAAGLPRIRESYKIAVIHASGDIMPDLDSPGFTFLDEENITAGKLGEQLKEARENDDVKAIVLRINSPGGSGTTSDLIWHDLRKTAEVKPVIASFGPLAASGGYYIGMAADTIVASSHTITGSIGVFGMMLNARELLNEKMGVHYDAVTSHDQSLWISIDRPMSETGQQLLQGFVDDFYQVFIERVALSRNMTPEQVHKVAQGRVWTGSQALEAGLVDLIGDLDDAIAIAAEKAGIENYTIESYPKPKGLLELFSSPGQSQIKTRIAQSVAPSIVSDLDRFQPVIEMAKQERMAIITRLPFDFKIQ